MPIMDNSTGTLREITKIVDCSSANIWNIKNDTTINNVKFTFDWDTLSVVSSGASATVSAIANDFKTKFTKHLKAGTYAYQLAKNAAVANVTTVIYNASDNSQIAFIPIGSTDVHERTGTFTLLEDTDVFVGTYIPSGTVINVDIIFTVVEGSIPPDHYIPFSYDITDIWQGDKHVFTVWDTTEGAFPRTFSANGDNAVEWEVWGNVADGANLWNESYPDITGASITYLPLLVGEGTFTMSSDFDASSTGFTDLFFLAGNVSSGVATATNGVYSGTSRTQTAIDGYITIAYRLSSTNDVRKAHTMLNAGSTALPYTPYSDSDRVGQRTENLFDNKSYSIVNQALNADGTTTSSILWSISEYIPVEAETVYTYYSGKPAGLDVGLCWYDSNYNYISGLSYNRRQIITVNSPANAAYCRLSVVTGTSSENYNADSIMLTLGSTAPSTYIPYGYEIPMAVGDGNTNETVNLYIGSTPLDSGEYTSYKDQKIYKHVNGVLTPTDPPVPIPALPTLNGVTVVDTELASSDVQPEKAFVKFRKMNS